MAPPFVPARDQDAWGSIRGFVYQVNVTIARWLALRGDEALLLECGEDIDHIAAAFAATDDRLLEQIKVREGALSLRAALALQGLANAVEQKRANPSVGLRFRFTTTATVAREQGHPEPDEPPGIEVWERLRKVGDRETEDLALLHRLLDGSQRPASVPETTWANAASEFADLTGLLSLVKVFEWAMATPSLDDQSAEVIRSLVGEGHARDEPRAHEIYEQLFAEVFRLLSRRGEKRLTRAALELAVARPRADLDPEAGAVIARLRGRLNTLGLRVTALDTRVGSLETQVAIAFGLPRTAIALGAPEFDVEPPPLAPPVAPRTALVGALAATAAPWLAIHGDAGVGKSHLALMLARAIDRRAIWVRLGRGSTAPDAGARLLRTLALVTRSTSLDARTVISSAVALTARESAVLVVDDLPALGRDHPVHRVLGAYLDQIGSRSLSLITSSVFPLPSALASSPTRCVVSLCPPFTEAETRELFGLYEGAAFLDARQKVVTFLTTVARGHPTLLRAMASFLRDRQWTWDQASFDAVFGGQYAESTHAETRAALLASVADKETRHLLERLQLRVQDFSLDDIRAVASVAPTISRPLERAREVEGTWLQRTSATRFRVSPLLSALPRELPLDVAKACHIALAHETLKQPLDQDSGGSVVSDFAAGGAYDMAGIILTDLLLSLSHEAKVIPPGLLLDVWQGAPLPEGMSLGVRIILRNAQMAAGRRYDKRPKFPAQELDELIQRAGDGEQWAVTSVEVQRFMRDFDTEPEQAADSLDRALGAAVRARLPDGRRYPFPDLAPLVWIRGVRLPTRRHLRAWLRLVARLPVEARAWDDRDGGRAATACQLACDHVWLDELDKPEANRRWGEVHEALDEIQTSAQRMRFPFLEVCAVRAKMTVLAEQNSRKDDAIAIAEAAMSEHQANEACVALIEEGLGRLHFYAKSPARALSHLRLALDHAATLGSLGPLVANYASRAAALVEPQSAVKLARVSVELATAAEDASGVSAIGLIQAKGELALALWNASEEGASAAALLDAAEHLHAHIADKGVTRRIGVGFVQLAMPIAMKVVEARIPEDQRRIPDPGFLFERPGGSGVKWRSDFPILLAFNMCQLASFTNDETRVRVWAGRALDHGDEGAENGLSASLQLQLLGYLLLSERDDALVAVANGLCRIVAADGRTTGEFRMELQKNPILLILGGVLPLSLSLGTMAIGEPSRAKALAEECGRIISECAKGHAISEIFAEAAFLLSAPHRGASYHELGPPADRPQPLQDLAFVQSTLCDDFPIERACSTHLRILPLAWRLQRGGMGRLVERFLDRFWTSAFRRMRFRFHNPRELERTLNDLATLPLTIRSRQLLGAVTDDFGIKNVPTEVRGWCRAR